MLIVLKIQINIRLSSSEFPHLAPGSQQILTVRCRSFWACLLVHKHKRNFLLQKYDHLSSCYVFCGINYKGDCWSKGLSI